MPLDTSTDAPLIDHSVFNEVCDLFESRDDFNQLIYEFKDEAYINIRKLADAASSADLVTINKISHALKSSSGNLGFIKLSQCAATLETMAREAMQADYIKLVSDLNESYQELTKELI